MKKILCLVLVGIMLLTVVTGCKDTTDDPVQTTETTVATTEALPSVQESPASDFKYTENEDGTITITGYIGNDTDVVIPRKIAEKDVTQLGSYVFYNHKNIVSVRMPDSVTTIKGLAFTNCTSLTTVVLSQTLSVIGGSAFEGCTALENIALPDSLTFVEARAFKKCTALKNIRIPSNCLNEYSWECFVDAGLETVIFEEGLEIIPDSAFSGTNLKAVVLPSTVKTIGWGSFGDCPELVSITLNEGLEEIGDKAFWSAKITEIMIPKSVKNVIESAFGGCTVLESVKFEGNAPKNYKTTSTDPLETHYTVYYHEGAEGFTSPEWCGYPTKLW